MQENWTFIAHKERLHTTDEAGRLHYGANQIWYPALWQQKAGCGPTVAATLFTYLAQTRAPCKALCTHPTYTQQGFLALMQEVWGYVTPGMMGSTIEIFLEGALRYAKDRGVTLTPEVLDIPAERKKRPDEKALAAFFKKAFEADLPIAFQNYSNGALKNLDPWHWVTLVGFMPATLHAHMYDQSKQSVIDTALYLETASKAGKFVILWP